MKKREKFSTKNRIISVIVAVSILFSLCSTTLFTVSAADNNTVAYSSATAEEEVQDYANGNGISNENIFDVSDNDEFCEAFRKASQVTGDYIISVQADFEIDQVSFSGLNSTLTFFGNGHTLTRKIDSGTEATFTFSSFNTFNFGANGYTTASRLILDGCMISSSEGCIRVTKGILNIYDGVEIINARCNNTFGGAISLGTYEDSSGENNTTLNMYGGVIKDCKVNNIPGLGGSVFISKISTFNMFGGTISGSSSNYGGAVCNFNKFNMYGGLITNTTATNYIESEIYGLGGAVYNNDSAEFIMEGGTISECKSEGYGGAVFNNSSAKFMMKGGTISECHSEYYGGAVYMNANSIFDMRNGEIHKCTSKYAGGVFNYQGEFSMHDGTIHECISDTVGGAIVTWGNTLTNLFGGDIYNNTSDNVGGGIYLYGDYDVINVYWGILHDNVSKKAGDDIYIESPTEWGNNFYFYDETGARIYDNENNISGWYEDGIFGYRYNAVVDKELNYSSTQEYGDAHFNVGDKYLYKVNNNSMSIDTYKPGYDFDPENGACIAFKAVYAEENIEVKFHENRDSNSTESTDDIYRTYTADDNTYILCADKTIAVFDDIPENDGYIFEGWYSDPVGGTPMKWSDTYTSTTHLYAHWLKIDTVDKDSNDTKIIVGNTYNGFDLPGIQVRAEGFLDLNTNKVQPSGLRFVSVVKEDILETLDKLFSAEYSVGDTTYSKKYVNYGYAMASEKQAKSNANGDASYKIKLGDTDVKDIDCTSKQKGTNGSVEYDHKNFGDYRLFTAVIEYSGLNDAQLEKAYSSKIVARSYLKYTDANGLYRTFYNDYTGTNTYGGCSACYNDAK